MDSRNNIIESIQNNLIYSFRTNNIIIDTLLSGLIMYIMKKIYDFICKMHFSRILSMLHIRVIKRFELAGFNETVEKLSSKKDYSPSFKAVSHYIMEHKDTIKLDGISENFIQNQSNSADTKYFFSPMSYTKIKNIIPGLDAYIYKYNESKSMKHITLELLSKKLSIVEIAAFVSMCNDEYEKYMSKLLNNQLYFSYRSSRYHILFNEIQFKSNVTFNTIFMPEKKEFLAYLDTFLLHPELYIQNGMEHHCSILLSGPPGCGKTSLIKAIINHTKRHVISVNFKLIESGEELYNLFSRESFNDKKIPMDKRIYVFEDYEETNDILKSRKNKKDNDDDNNEKKDKKNKKSDESSESTLTLSDVLNIFDGVTGMPGRLMIFTSNHPEILDDALLRPGRSDYHIEFKLASHQIIKEILEKIYNVEVSIESLQNIKEYILSPALIFNICIKNNNLQQCIDTLITLSNK